MKHELVTELLISFVLLVFLILLLHPFGFFMPGRMHMMMLLLMTIIFVIFAGFIWKEKARDERELLHRSIAARFAFLSGMGILVGGVLAESIGKHLDPWLIVALGVMVIAKVVGLIYSQRNH